MCGRCYLNFINFLGKREEDFQVLLLYKCLAGPGPAYIVEIVASSKGRTEISTVILESQH